MTAARGIAGVIFDKDGTLYDFAGTWNVWAAGVIDDLAAGDRGARESLARHLRYDLAAQAFFPDSPVIAGTNREAAECIHRALPDRPVEEVELYLIRAARSAPLHEAVPLVPFLSGLRGRKLRLGVVTNDTETTARAHLKSSGVTDHFDFIAGFDSGHGVKPGPEPLLAFTTATGLAPGQVVMVGDSTHDLIAGRRAGMACVGVLTGPARRADLLPHADVVLDDIGGLPGWLDARGAG